MSKEIAGELFVRNRDDLNGRRVIMIGGILQIDRSVQLLGEHFYYASGFMYQGKPLLLVHQEGCEDARKRFNGYRLDQIMCERRWRIPQIPNGQYIGKPTAVEIERDYF
jgi:hypothetical protein